MIQEFVNRFMGRQDKLAEQFREKHPGRYLDIVTTVIDLISDDGYGEPCSGRITSIDHGDYQGTLVFVIGAGGYQPDDYWYVRVYYGSCSGCDTLEAIRGYSDNAPNDEQVKDYMTLALHIVQGIRKMGDD